MYRDHALKENGFRNKISCGAKFFENHLIIVSRIDDRILYHPKHLKNIFLNVTIIPN